MGDFGFYPELNTKFTYIFTIHEIIDKITPKKFDTYLEIVKFTLELFKKRQEEIIVNINDINIIYKKIDHIVRNTKRSDRFMKDELIFLNRFKDFFNISGNEIELNMALYPELLGLLKTALRLRNRRMRKITLWSFWRKPPYLELNSTNNIYLFIFENNERLLTKFDMKSKTSFSGYTKKEMLQLIVILENIFYTINYLMYKSESEDRILFSDNKNITVKDFYDKIKKIEDVELSRLYKRTLSLWDFWSEKFEKINVRFNLEEEAYI